MANIIDSNNEDGVQRAWGGRGEVTHAKTIYDRLNEFTGDIEQFIKHGTDDVYKSSAYMDFGINCVIGRRMMFGFRKAINGDSCPDPVYSISLGDGEADVDSLIMETLLGHVFRGEEAAADCAEFLQEMITRKKNGIMELAEHVTY